MQSNYFWFLACCVALIALGFVWHPIFCRKQIKIVFATGIIFFISVFSLYFHWGESDQLVHLDALKKIDTALQELSQDSSLSEKKAYAQLDILRAEVALSHAGLARLGAIYIQLGAPEKARSLYEKALEQMPDNNEYKAQWIYSHALMHRGVLPEAVYQSSIHWLAKNPEQSMAMNLVAIHEYIKGDWEQALSHWEQALNNNNLDITSQNMMQKAAAFVKEQLDARTWDQPDQKKEKQNVK